MLGRLLAGYRMGWALRVLSVHDPARADGPSEKEFDAFMRDLVSLVWVKQTDAACLD